MIWQDLPDPSLSLTGYDGSSIIVYRNDFTTANVSLNVYTAYSTTLTQAEVLDNVKDKYRISGIIGTTSLSVLKPGNNIFELYLDSNIVFRHELATGTAYIYWECYISRMTADASGNTALCVCKLFTNDPRVATAPDYYALHYPAGIPTRKIPVTWDSDLDVKVKITKYDTAGTIDYYNCCIEKIETV